MKDYYLTFDTETANTLDDPFVYNIGGAIHDRYGVIVETFSFIIKEVFFGMAELMNTSYYAEKIPQYCEGIANGEYEIVSFYEAREHIANLCEMYNVKACIAHNARFDYRATAKTQRYLTKSKYRFFLPYGVELWDTLKMARQVMKDKPQYHNFCFNNGYLTKNGKSKLTAEVLYRWITRDTSFIESHTALEDVLIEKEIFAYIVRQGVITKIDKKCFADQGAFWHSFCPGKKFSY